MDPNGVRFHLLKGEVDWRTCQEEACERGWENLDWDASAASLSLRRRLPLFRRPQGTTLDLAARRDAGVDRFGNWYWISADRRQVIWRPSGGARWSAVYWTQTATPPAPAPGQFQTLAEPPPAVELAGLAITEHHYLVVGNVTQSGVLLFDLHAGGEPRRLLFPEPFESGRFIPFAMTPAPGGGVWILDREHRCYWGLDREFRLVALAGPTETEAAPIFHRVDEPVAVPQGRPLSAPALLAAQDPIAIAALADGSVLIVDRSPAPAASLLYHYRGEWPLQPPLAFELEVATKTDAAETEATEWRPVSVHAIACNGDPHKLVLYVADDASKQIIVYTLDLGASPPRLEAGKDYLPLRAFGGRGLVWNADDQAVYYDLGGADRAVSWVSAQVIEEPAYARQAVALTALFDGKTRDCVWDSLFLDGCIPPETTVTVFSRAGNDTQLLDAAPFQQEPPLYRRGAGAELPYYDPFAELKAAVASPAAQAVLPAGLGTWELLFQQAQGRYLQLRLELQGNGRASPRLQALRAYYPRFSYVRNYLPAVYREDQISAWFLERLLANPKGFFTDIEAKIEAVSLLFDPRGAPPDALDWLGTWVGLTLDPLWSELNRRRADSAAPNGRPPPDRRRLLICFAPRLYACRGTPNGLLFALELLLNPCLETVLERLQRATLRRDDGLQAELRRLELPYPTPRLSAADLEDLLFAYVVSPRRHSQVRIVERFKVRGGRAAVTGDLTAPADDATDFVHRFSVLIPADTTLAETAMVKRITELEKPAHAAFDIRRYWDYFRVGEARLGIDTIAGEADRFLPVLLGRQALGAGYIAPPPDADERLILERAALGRLPPL
jgi:hypothetical protein